MENNDQGGKSKKRKCVRKKSDINPKSSSRNPTSNKDDVISDEKINEYLKSMMESIRQSIDGENKQIQEREEDEASFQPLEAILKEFLNCYLIIGFTPKGERVTMGYASNRMERDAINEHLRAYFIRSMSQNMGE